MTQNIQISFKEHDGTILVVGGNDVNEFMENAEALVGREGADEIQARFMNLIPMSGSPATGQQQGSYAPRQGAGNPPGNETLCPTHNQHAVWKEGGVSSRTNQPYKGFWKCPVTDASISNFNGIGLKPACPLPK